MLILNLIILHQLVRMVTSVSLSPESRHVVFDRFNGMCSGKRLPMLSTNVLTKVDKRLIYFNSTMTVKENVGKNLKCNINMIRCLSKENLDTCENFMQHTDLNFCQLVNPAIGNLSPVFINYTPELKCPIAKGVYKAYNTKIDTSVFIVFPLGDYYWRVRIEVFDGDTNRIIYCFQTDAHEVKSH